MARRLLESLAGLDVLTAEQADVQFTSLWTGMMRIRTERRSPALTVTGLGIGNTTPRRTIRFSASGAFDIVTDATARPRTGRPRR